MTLEEAARRWQIAEDTQQCFNTEVGKRVLAQLEQDFACRTSFNINSRTMSFLEGERHVILTIKSRLAMRRDQFIHSVTAMKEDADV
jgi:hypothetical protein